MGRMAGGSGNLSIRYVGLPVILVAWVFAAGCATQTTPAPPPPTATATPVPLDAEAVLGLAVDWALNLSTATFALDHWKGSTTLFPGVEMTRASGVVHIPDKYRLVIEAQSTTPKAYFEVTVVSVGDEVRMTDFFTGRWRAVPQSVLPVDFSRLGVTVSEIVEGVVAPELGEMETVAGVETRRIRGSIQSQQLAGLVPGSVEGFDVGMDLWVEIPEGVVHQVLISGQVLSTDIPGSQRLLTLGDFDQPIAIDLPE